MYDLFVLSQNTSNVVWCNLTVNVVVDCHNWGKTTATYATSCVQTKFAVACAFATFNGKKCLQFFVNFARTLNVARCTKTDTNAVFSLWEQTKLRVECNNAVNVGQGNIQFFCDDGLRFVRKISVKPLSRPPVICFLASSGVFMNFS